MNYNKHYSLLIQRGLARKLEGQKERHHIIPKCIGGTDDSNNLVELTPEEHFLAHQLLVKIYPTNQSLVYAAMMMCCHSKFNVRSNKIYGWLKRSYQTICKQRVGDKNGSYGTRWVTDGVTPIKIKRTDQLPEGFCEGRTIKHKTYCSVCGEQTNSTKAKYCDEHRNRRKNTDPNEVLTMYEEGVPMQIILEKFGWKVEQNVTTYLRKNFPDRKKFLPKERTNSH